MSDKITENLNDILEQVEANLLPENLKKGVSLLGVDGTLEEGIDTSDATATANDIALYKTAYINGEKVEGTVWDGRGTSDEPTRCILGGPEDVNIEYDEYHMAYVLAPSTQSIVDNTTRIVIEKPVDEVASTIGLTSDKIVKGNTILGVEGSASTSEVLLGEHSATFISNKPYDDGSNVIVMYTNDENKLDSIPEPVEFTGKFDGYCDITNNAYNSNITNLTTDTVFATNKVYRAKNTEGYVYTFAVNESDINNCALIDSEGNEVTSITSDVLLAGQITRAPEVSMKNNYRHIGWISDGALEIFEQSANINKTINPIITNDDTLLTFTLIPDDANYGFSEYTGMIAYEFAHPSQDYCIIGVLGKRGITDEGNSIAGWKTLTYTIDASINSYVLISDFFGLGNTYVDGTLTIIDNDTNEEIAWLSVYDNIDFSVFTSGKTYRVYGSLNGY